ncbi:hypothetical protein V6N13_148232 [Hibiscus sabdariffa]
MGQYADDRLYPLAFAIMDSECESAWTWSLYLLKNDLELKNSQHILFMTDRQKGLLESVMELFPYSEHITCVRHFYNNFKLFGDHQSKALKDQLWKAARKTYVREFEVAMAKFEMILEARDKGIITLVESIRLRLMQRIAKKRDEGKKSTSFLCPKIQRKLDNAITLSNRCCPLRANGSMYQSHVVLQTNILLKPKHELAHVENGN